MITGKDKFCYSYGFLDCFMMMSGDNQKMREQHAWVIEEMWAAFLPGVPTNQVQSLINDMNKSQIWKIITKTMQNKNISDVLTKGIKDKMSSY